MEDLEKYYEETNPKPEGEGVEEAKDDGGGKKKGKDGGGKKKKVRCDSMTAPRRPSTRSSPHRRPHSHRAALVLLAYGLLVVEDLGKHGGRGHDSL